MNKNLIHGMTALLFVLVVCISSAAADDTVTRDLPDSAGAGAPITVNLTVGVETSATYYSIDEIVPSGWTVTSATDGGEYTADPGHVKWVVTGGVANKVYSYTVDVPADASGAYTFDGIYMFEGMTVEATILGDTNVTVAVPVLTAIVVLPATANLTVGSTQVFTATAYDQFGSVMSDIVITWDSSNTAVGTINASTGVFTAVAAGTTTVTATSSDVNGTAVVTVCDSADTNHDCVVSMPELMTQIGKWKSAEIGMSEMMTSIGRWKLGSGGYC